MERSVVALVGKREKPEKPKPQLELGSGSRDLKELGRWK